MTLAFLSISKPFTVFLMIAILISSKTVKAGVEHQHSALGWVHNTGSVLSSNDLEEFEFDSEISRRILASSRYISYGAMQRNSVPCSRRGASYYNCRNGAQANPYNRGCSAITRCRR